jgi:hypothetical protein
MPFRINKKSETDRKIYSTVLFVCSSYGKYHFSDIFTVNPALTYHNFLLYPVNGINKNAQTGRKMYRTTRLFVCAWNGKYNFSEVFGVKPLLTYHNFLLYPVYGIDKNAHTGREMSRARLLG